MNKQLKMGIDDHGIVWRAITEGHEFVLQYCIGYDGSGKRKWDYHCRRNHPEAAVEIYKSERAAINAINRRCTTELLER